jgi:uncharacterized CHY-type Zn-finger protein
MEHQFFNEWKFYLDKTAGYWISCSCPKKRMHVVVWEYFNGPVPKKFHIHHKDGDKSNNDISNLEMIYSSEHSHIHMTPEKKEKLRKLADIMRPMTKAWHASKEGHEWHKKHGIKTWNERNPIDVICDKCGKKFSTLIYHSRFCSNKCRSAHRLSQGVDDITIQCEYCKKEFKKNKYAKPTTCSRTCGCKLSWSKGNHKKK